MRVSESQYDKQNSNNERNEIASISNKNKPDKIQRFSSIISNRGLLNKRENNNILNSAKMPISIPIFVRHVLLSPGQELDENTKANMESRFNHDLSSVRIHISEKANSTAEALGARAYTVGNHIIFGKNNYNPTIQKGRRLLLHELSHVVQQLNGSRESYNTSEAYAEAQERQITKLPIPVHRKSEFSEILQCKPDRITGFTINRTDSTVTISIDEGEPIHADLVDISLESGNYQAQYDERGGLLITGLSGETIGGNLVEFQMAMTEAIQRRYIPLLSMINEPVPFNVLEESAVGQHALLGYVRLTPESAIERFRLGQLYGIMTFPIKFGRVGDSPLNAVRDDEDIVVRLPLRVRSNDRFREEIQTLPDEVFLTEGLRLRPTELVCLKFYDIEDEPTVLRTGGELLELSRITDIITFVQIGATILDGILILTAPALSRGVSWCLSRGIPWLIRWGGRRVSPYVIAASLGRGVASSAPTAFSMAESGAIIQMERGAAHAVERATVEAVTERAVVEATAEQAITRYALGQASSGATTEMATVAATEELATTALASTAIVAAELGLSAVTDDVTNEVFAALGEELETEAPGTVVVEGRSSYERFAAVQELGPTLTEGFGETFHTAIEYQVQLLGQQLDIPIPEDRVIVAPWGGPTGRLTSAGYRRDSSAYWTAFRRAFPGDYTLIGPGHTITAELAERWGWPEELIGERLIHHHMENGPIVVAIPESLHQGEYSVIHARPTVEAEP